MDEDGAAISRNPLVNDDVSDRFSVSAGHRIGFNYYQCLIVSSLGFLVGVQYVDEYPCERLGIILFEWPEA